MEIFREFCFEAAHRLTGVPADHKCSRLHGHSYRLEVHVAGEVDSQSGMVMDFADIKTAAGPICEENPTSENVARWVWERLKPALPELSKIVVRETCTSGCTYVGEEHA
jgi:6-pyruvoyltetrahydropterin/6-carboxytetrahydropterin synthase